jgi:glycosyltransferase involved in cell wall biosynthesis
MIASGQPEMYKKAAVKKVVVFNPVFNAIKGGGEKLLLEMRNQFGADLLAGSIDFKAWGKENSGHDSFVDLLWSKNLGFQHLVRESRIPGWRRLKRNIIFRFAPRVKHLNRYELVIFYGDPAGIPCRIRSPKKMLYCNTPPRHLTDQKQDFLKKFPGPLRPIVDLFLRRDLKRYSKDIRLMDLIISNSENIRQRLQAYTGVNSLVIFPAVFIEKFKYLGQKDYYLSYARLDDWKRIRLIIAAFERMPEKKLIVASAGSLRKWLEREIENYPNIIYVGQISDEQLARWIGNCIAGIYIPVNEDAGITPCELMAAGKPVIGVREGGILETIIDRKTGILIKTNPGIEDLINAVNWLTPAKALQMKEDCICRSRQFDQSVFFKKMSAAIASLDFQKHSGTV